MYSVMLLQMLLAKTRTSYLMKMRISILLNQIPIHNNSQ
jgi:hypothetical protein